MFVEYMTFTTVCTYYSELPLIRPPLGQSVLINAWGGLISGVNLYYKAYFGTFQNGQNTGVEGSQLLN